MVRRAWNHALGVGEAVRGMLLDSDYLLIGLPPLALSVWAQWRLVSACRMAGRVPASAQVAGADAARRIMESAGAETVPVEVALGQLSDYYHPARGVLRLSPDVASGRSLAALGVAAHEAGHAVRDGNRFLPLLRGLLVPLANLFATTFWLLVFAGLFLGMFRLIIWSVFVLWLGLVLQLLNLPAELGASRRAQDALVAQGLLTAEEAGAVHPVLKAAAWSHVGGLVSDLWPIRPLLLAFRSLS